MAYISREKALLELQKFSFDTYESYGCGYSDCLTAVEDVLNDLPAADVEEVKHGGWIKKPFVSDLLRKTVKSEFIYTCSVCGYDSISESNYCRQCGAKMDGGKNENV